MDAIDFQVHVIGRTLEEMGEPYANEGGWVARFLLEIAAHESMGFDRIQQMGGGPAVSFYQFEPPTIHDTAEYINVRAREANYHTRVFNAVAGRDIEDLRNFPESAVWWVQTDMVLATLLARFKLWMVPVPIPSTLQDRAEYWKLHWNTVEGKGTPGGFIESVETYLW